MFLKYQPEGSSEPKMFNYNPKKLMSAEREVIEKLTGMSFEPFASAVIEGNSKCRRALLYTFLKRDNKGLRFEDVDFAWDELELVFSKAELIQFREKAVEKMEGEDLANALAAIDEQLEDAPEDPESGKA